MEKLFYEAPQTLVFDVKIQGVICGSERGITEKYTVGGTYGDGDFNE